MSRWRTIKIAEAAVVLT